MHLEAAESSNLDEQISYFMHACNFLKLLLFFQSHAGSCGTS